MKAVLLYAYGDPGQLRYEDTDMPKYGDNEVLVKIRATSINPIDLKMRSGAWIPRRRSTNATSSSAIHAPIAATFPRTWPAPCRGWCVRFRGRTGIGSLRSEEH